MNDPIYNSPESELKDDNLKPKRPLLVWVIFIFSCLGLFGLVTHFSMVSGSLPLEGPARDYYQQMSVFDHILIVVFTLFNFICALMLFRLKLVAVKLYWTYIGLSVLYQAYNWLDSSYRKLAMSQPGVEYSMAFSVLWMVFLLWYLQRLRSKQLLRA